MEARNEEAAAVMGLGARQKTMVEDKKKVWSILENYMKSLSTVNFFKMSTLHQDTVKAKYSVFYRNFTWK